MADKVTKAIIPVAGFGTRFLPVTKTQPKEMLPIVDTPIIGLLVEEAVQSGITDILFVIHPTRSNLDKYFSRDKKLEDFLEERGKQNLVKELEYIHGQANFSFVVQDEPLGTGDATYRGKDFVNNEPFALFWADDLVISNTNRPAIGQLIDAYKKYSASISGLFSVEKQEVSKYGVMDGKRVDERTHIIKNMIEKPKLEEAPSTLVSVGRFVLTPNIFDYIERVEKTDGEVLLPDAIAMLSRDKNVYGHEIDGVWHDCGSKFGYWKANLEIGLEHKEIKEEARKYLENLKSK